MSSSVIIVPGQPISLSQLEKVRDGEFELDQWGHTVPIDPTNPDGNTRRVTFFEVVREPELDPYASAAGALLFFAEKGPIFPGEPSYLGTVDVTDTYINARFWKE